MAYEFHAEQWLPRPIEDVFAFFTDAANLTSMTPPSMSFRMLTPAPIAMHVGTLIDYTLKVRGVPIRWQSEITAWEPPHRFVDEQRSGPYRQWRHEHSFIEQNGGTLVRDHVTYAVPGGALINRLVVRPDLEKIFAYRQKVLAERFGSSPSAAEAN